jgi:ABC-type methionine transport system ATPase subunit
MPIERTVRLSYPKHLLNQPLIYHLIRQFDLLTNIVEARVSDEEGCLMVIVSGEPEQVHQGLAWLVEQGVKVEDVAKEEACES